MSLPAAWKQWVLKGLLQGSDPRELLKILLNNGFTFEASVTAIGRGNLPKGIASHRDQRFYQRLSQPKLVREWQHMGAEFIEQEKAQLLRIQHFLSPVECKEVIALAKTQLRPSTIAARSGYEGFRTSTTCDLPYLKQPAADAVDKKIIDTLGVGLGENEVIQAQHYAPGQQFKAHTDYFEPGSDEYKEHCLHRGQRTWTFMVYLNQECEGGETEFAKLDLTFKPQTGTALIWNNLLPDGSPNPNTLHQAHPVQSGEKVVITKWFREQQQ